MLAAARDPGRPPSAPPAPGAAAPAPAPHTTRRAPGELLTWPSAPVSNCGRDNEHSDLIMRVGDALTNERGVR